MAFEKTINFTTVSADQDIFADFITPGLSPDVDASAGTDLDIEILFDASYTGNITINGRVTKAYANTVVRHSNPINSIIIETSGTSGQVRVNL